MNRRNPKHPSSFRNECAAPRCKINRAPFPDDTVAADELVQAVEQLRFVRVVGPAAELDVVDGRLASDGMGLDMMPLQEAALGAAAPARTAVQYVKSDEKPGAQVEAAGVELREVGDLGRGRGACAVHEAQDFGHEFCAREAGWY